jgi:hypothetical protein
MTLPSERTLAKDQPIARYRIIQRHGNGQATIEYADDLESALQHRADLGGDATAEIEEYCAVGDGWRICPDNARNNPLRAKD